MHRFSSTELPVRLALRGLLEFLLQVPSQRVNITVSNF